MKIYPILSSDIYQLSCVPVSMLEPLGDVDLRKHLDERGGLKFLVAQDTMGRISTDTGYMSKHVDYATISTVLAQDFTLDTLQDGVASLSDYVKRYDLEQISVIIDGLPRPYIISAFYLSGGHISGMAGYALSDALVELVPTLRYSSVSAASAAFEDLSAPVIDSIRSKIPPEASDENQLADKMYVSALVDMNASSFRGMFDSWAAVPSAASEYLSDVYGSHAPDVNDYMVVRRANDYQASGRAWPSGTLETEKQGAWRFRYIGKWSDSDVSASRANWVPEYRIEQFNFTSEQIAAINSGVEQNTWVKRIPMTQYGSPTRGVFVDSDGNVVTMNYTLGRDVLSSDKLTDTVPAVGNGLKSEMPENGTTPIFSVVPATDTRVGGLCVGKGLSNRPDGSYFVDACAAVRVVEVAWNDETSIDNIADSVFGDSKHDGAIMVVKRRFRLNDELYGYTGYVYSNGQWRAMDGNCSAENVILPEDIQFSGGWSSIGNVHNVQNGFFACGGKSVADAFRMMFGDGDQTSYVHIPVVDEVYFPYDGSEHGPLSAIGAELDERITVGGTETATDAGEYAVILKLPAGGNYKWSDGSTADINIPWEIGHMIADIPEITYSFTYDGSEHSPIDLPEDPNELPYTITGDYKETELGNNYSCTLTLKQNYMWSNETFENIIINWKIVEES